MVFSSAHTRAAMKARARHAEEGARAGNDGPGAPASPSAMPLQHPSGRSPGSQAGRDPGAAPSHAVAQWRSAAPLLAYRCGGSAGIARGSNPRSAPASRFIPSDEGPPGHLKPAHYLRRHARLSIAMTASPAELAARSAHGAHARPQLQMQVAELLARAATICRIGVERGFCYRFASIGRRSAGRETIHTERFDHAIDPAWIDHACFRLGVGGLRRAGRCGGSPGCRHRHPRHYPEGGGGLAGAYRCGGRSDPRDAPGLPAREHPDRRAEGLR